MYRLILGMFMVMLIIGWVGCVIIVIFLFVFLFEWEWWFEWVFVCFVIIK